MGTQERFSEKVTSAEIIERRERTYPAKWREWKYHSSPDKNTQDEQSQPHPVEQIELSQSNNIFERGQSTCAVIEDLNHIIYMRMHYYFGKILENSAVKLTGHES